MAGHTWKALAEPQAGSPIKLQHTSCVAPQNLTHVLGNTTVNFEFWFPFSPRLIGQVLPDSLDEQLL